MSYVKICGLSRIEDIEAVNRTLPDYIGFVFAPSQRRVDVKTATMLKEKLDPKISVVGVFVNENISIIGEMHGRGIIGFAQLHGDEDSEYISRLKDHYGCPVIKAVGVGSTLPPPPTLPTESDYLLFDTLSRQRGGVGKSFDWSLLKDYSGLPYFLAGGLTAKNVSGLIRMLAPFCVDVSSGVETDGKKDAKKIEEFVYFARGNNL